MKKKETAKKSKKSSIAESKNENKKSTVVTQNNSFMVHMGHVIKVVVVGGLIIFCVFNVVASQLMPALYFQFIKGDQRAEVEFIKKARLLPEFQKIFPEIRQMFIKHEDEVYADQRARRSMITQLEAVLEKNPHSRDVLYALARLYEQEGNLAQAETYLNQARELDPLIDKK